MTPELRSSVTTQGEIFETVTEPVESVSDDPEVAVKDEAQVETAEPATERPTAARRRAQSGRDKA